LIGTVLQITPMKVGLLLFRAVLEVKIVLSIVLENVATGGVQLNMMKILLEFVI
jgi:hypothetical protein